MHSLSSISFLFLLGGAVCWRGAEKRDTGSYGKLGKYRGSKCLNECRGCLRLWYVWNLIFFIR